MHFKIMRIRRIYFIMFLSMAALSNIKPASTATWEHLKQKKNSLIILKFYTIWGLNEIEIFDCIFPCYDIVPSDG